MAITPLQSLQMKKVWVFWKIQHKSRRISSKMYKIYGKMAEKNELKIGKPPLKMGQIQCIKFLPLFMGN